MKEVEKLGVNAAGVPDRRQSMVSVIDQSQTGPCGTLAYMAPELLEWGAYSELVDVYSYAMCLWEMLVDEEPWQDISDDVYQITVNVSVRKERPKIPDATPPEFAALITACWASDPNDRPQFPRVVELLELMDFSTWAPM